MTNIIIRSCGKYVPEKVLTKDFFKDHFAKEENGEIDISGLMRAMGRNTIHVAERGENSLTMAHAAALDAMSRCDIDAESIDMIVFVSTTPEYTAPTNALKLSSMLQTKNAQLVYDMNCNCTGMLVAMDTVSKTMRGSDNIKRALIVGSMYSSSVVRFNDSLTYSNFGDAGSAIILDKVEEDVVRGFIDAEYLTDASYSEQILLPACGHSNERLGKLHKYYRRLEWVPFDTDFMIDAYVKLINRIFDKNQISDDDVAYYCFSQFSNKYNEKALDAIGNTNRGKYIFNADKYGYLACSSPIIALDEIFDDVRKLQEGYIVFCSVAAGISFATTLYKL